jgi:hypothetical protein
MSIPTTKQIVIQGTNTRYQMKKVSGMRNKDPKSRINMNSLDDMLFTSENQINALRDLSNNNTDVSPIYLKEITNKLHGYRSQDILKNRLDESTFITISQTVELLNSCRLSCFYCKCFTNVLYKNVRDMSQWSLDRIDNNIGHTYTNVVISCLQCNLQKKRISMNAFTMTKQMVLTKVE